MKDGYYRFASERAATKCIGQLIDGQWYLINEVGPVPIEEINRRGWTLDRRVKGMRI